jgi:uncharacterized OB-fold protein
MTPKDEPGQLNEFHSAIFQQSLNDGKLVGVSCRKCGRRYLPPRPVCPECHSSDMELTAMPEKGRLMAYTVISVGPPMMVEAGFDREHPYCCGVVELAEGIRVSARIEEVDVQHPERIKVGIPVTAGYQAEKMSSGQPKTVLVFRTAA